MERSAEKSPLVLNLDELEEGITRLNFQVGAEEIELSDAYFSFPRPFQVELDVHRTFENFTVNGRIRCCIKGECCRCLIDVEQPLEAPLKLLFQRKQATDEELEALAEEVEVEIISPGIQELDLTSRLLETIAVELPVRVYCKEDCKGLCPSCGHDLNEGACSCGKGETDPRWAALKGIEFS